MKKLNLQYTPPFKLFVPTCSDMYVVYQIQCPQYKLNYVGQTSHHLQLRFKEHIGNIGPIKHTYENCAITPTDDVLSILVSMYMGDGRLLTLKALFVKNIVLNTKDDFRSRTPTLKF